MTDLRKRDIREQISEIVGFRYDTPGAGERDRRFDQDQIHDIIQYFGETLPKRLGTSVPLYRSVNKLIDLTGLPDVHHTGTDPNWSGFTHYQLEQIWEAVEEVERPDLPTQEEIVDHLVEAGPFEDRENAERQARWLLKGYRKKGFSLDDIEVETSYDAVIPKYKYA